MIITLAVHVDHGKTSLVKALTGVDTDRLEEEKRRGLTIDLGFAYTDLDGHRIGFVDVPGHHRFVHNMVAGVAAHQLGLIVVAADDGVMPQTLEHLQILRLIGVERALFALTKIDRCDESRVDAVRADLVELARSHDLDGAQIIGTSITSGAGIDTLREALSVLAQETPDVHAEGAFRLAIDRAFLIRGSGLVVTGTVHSGTVRVGDELRLAPAGHDVRVRSLHVQDAIADRAQPGDRCAVNITGVERTDVERGHWLVDPEVFAPTRNAVVQLSVLDDFPRAVKHWLPVHAYLATGHSEGHVALLDSPPLRANDSALVELEFETPLHPKYGDRIVLRDHARERTIGGGPVIEVARARAGRRKTVRLRQLHDQLNSSAQEALAALLTSTDQGVDLDAFRLLPHPRYRGDVTGLPVHEEAVRHESNTWSHGAHPMISPSLSRACANRVFLRSSPCSSCGVTTRTKRPQELCMPRDALCSASPGLPPKPRRPCSAPRPLRVERL